MANKKGKRTYYLTNYQRELIYQYMFRHNMTLIDLSKAIDVCYQHTCRVINGTRPVGIRIAYKIYLLMGIDITRKD